MDALIGFLAFIATACFFIGAVTIVLPISQLGFTRRYEGALLIAASFAVIIFGRLLVVVGGPEPKQSTAASASAAPSVSASPASIPDRPISRTEALKRLTVDGFSWEKSGFGSVMMATFVIDNNNKFAVKDIEVTCIHFANSGTMIDRNTRTVYERIEAGSYQSIIAMNMGFIHSAATSSKCEVTDFSRV
jgi:hypothetical protein